MLNAACATYIYTNRAEEWENPSLDPLIGTLPGVVDLVKLFRKIELSTKREQLEPNVIAPSHLMVNCHVKINNNDIHGIDKDAWIRVSEANSDTYSCSPLFLTKSISKLCNSKKGISVEVENEMIKNDDYSEFRFCRHMGSFMKLVTKLACHPSSALSSCWPFGNTCWQVWSSAVFLRMACLSRACRPLCFLASCRTLILELCCMQSPEREHTISEQLEH